MEIEVQEVDATSAFESVWFFSEFVTLLTSGVDGPVQVSEDGVAWFPVSWTNQTGPVSIEATHALVEQPAFWRITGAPTRVVGVQYPIKVPQSGVVIPP